MITPICVARTESVGEFIASALDEAAGSSAFANPKSSTFTMPSARTLMLAGFRSRWMMPCSCAASSASAICFAIGSASSRGIPACLAEAPGARRRAMIADRSSPLTSSMTSAVIPACSSHCQLTID